jgi:hypothetical protein
MNILGLTVCTLVCTAPFIVSGLRGKCWLLVRIRGIPLLVPLTRKTRSVPSRSSRIRIFIEHVNFEATS